MSSQLVAIDLDGTLIGESLEVSADDRAAITRARDAGLHICLASGRLFASSRPFAIQLGLDDPIIGLQGAVAYETQTGRRLLCTPLQLDVARQAFEFCEAKRFHVQLYYGDDLYLDTLNEEARYYIRISRVEPVMVPSLRALLENPPPNKPGPIKVLAVTTPENVVSSIPELAKVLGTSRANVFRSLPRFLEVTDPNANKGYALEHIAAYLGVSMEDTAAIGDSDNDVPMFARAAQSYAVSNATPAAKACAARTVGPLGEGVAQALDIIMKGRAREPA